MKYLNLNSSGFFGTVGSIMRYATIDPSLFKQNRARVSKAMAPNALAIVNANDTMPTNADGSFPMRVSSDLFYLTGVEQEQTILLLYPDAQDEKLREILFLREPSAEAETWEGHKLTKVEARAQTGIRTVEWLQAFPRLFHRLMCECDHVHLNSNEHKRAIIDVPTREARFVAECQSRYPLHSYHRLARILHRIRAVKSDLEIEALRKACALTEKGFRRILAFTRPGVSETEVEAEFAHEFIRNRGHFAYSPIIASGGNACVLHYGDNSAVCKKGDLLLLDVAASYANYNSDMTRTIPVSGRFTPRQRKVYNAVLRVMRASIKGLVPGKLPKTWQEEAEQMVEKELIDLGLLTRRAIKRQDAAQPALKKYFMHGVGHPIGLDVHDVGITTEPMQAGWVMTCEPAIYIREENLAIRLENTVHITADGPVDLMASIPVEAEEIEDLMNSK